MKDCKGNGGALVDIGSHEEQSFVQSKKNLLIGQHVRLLVYILRPFTTDNLVQQKPFTPSTIVVKGPKLELRIRFLTLKHGNSSSFSKRGS